MSVRYPAGPASRAYISAICLRRGKTVDLSSSSASPLRPISSRAGIIAWNAGWASTARASSACSR